MHIGYLGLGFKEAWHPWSKYCYEFIAVKLIEYFVKVYLPLVKNRKIPEHPPMEHPRLPELPGLRTLTSDITDYYTDQAKNDNELHLKAL